MQSVLTEYYKGNHIGDALFEFNLKNPQHELGNITLLAYQTIIDPKLYEQNIKKINAVPYAEYPSEEQLLFLEILFWLYSSTLNRQNNAQTILSLINSLSKNEVPIEMKVMPIIMQGQLLSNNGDIQHLTKAHEKALQILKGKSERYHKILWDHLIHLYNTNQLDKTDSYLHELKKLLQAHTVHRRYNYILLLDAIAKSDWRRAKQEIELIEEDKNIKRFYGQTLNHYKNLSDLFLQTSTFEPQSKKSHLPLISYWFLMQKNKLKAMQYARAFAESNLKPFGISDFDSYCLIRSEIANGNIHTAEFILNKKRKAGANTLFDDYFWFRIFHLKGEKDKAAKIFGQFYKQCETLDLLKRLDTELTLSPDINLYDLNFYLERISDSQTSSTTTKVQNSNKEFTSTEIDEISEFLIGNSKSIQNLKEAILKTADSELPILIKGETGTGKELVAKAIHLSSNRKKKKFIAINCGAISDHLLQSELFGHKQGAFTGANTEHKGLFEAANDGIIFLDEIGEISLKMQISLLRVLESLEYYPLGDTKSKKIKCKLIFATNRNLNEMVKKGSFRQDLQYRLERLTLEIPPLREHTDDIPLLTQHFLNTLNPLSPPISIDEPLMKHLQKLKWLGNIRELKNEMERLRLFHSDQLALSTDDLSEKYRTIPTSSKQPVIKPLESSIAQFNPLINVRSKFRKLDELKQGFIQYNKLSRTETSKLLRISLNTAAQYLNDLEIEGYIEKITPTNSAKSHYYQIKNTEK